MKICKRWWNNSSLLQKNSLINRANPTQCIVSIRLSCFIQNQITWSITLVTRIWLFLIWVKSQAARSLSLAQTQRLRKFLKLMLARKNRQLSFSNRKNIWWTKRNLWWNKHSLWWTNNQSRLTSTLLWSASISIKMPMLLLLSLLS